MKPNGKPEIPLEQAAHEIGRRSYDQIKEEADQVVYWEKIKREKENAAEIAALRARASCLMQRREELLTIRRLAPPEDLRSTRRRLWFYWTVAFIFAGAGLGAAHMALFPFDSSWATWALCLGIALAMAFTTDYMLEKVKSDWCVKGLAIVAFLASLSGIIVLALLRGDVLELYLRMALAGEMQDGALASDFYQASILKLKLLMMLLAGAMELASGMAVFEARKIDLVSPERAAQARKELKSVEEELTTIVGRITHLENDGAICEATFHRNLCLGMLDRIKRNGLVHMLVVLAMLLSSIQLGCTRPGDGGIPGPQVQPAATLNVVLAPEIRPAATLNVVLALDLTQSVAGVGSDGKSDFEKNIEGACNLISALPPGTRVTVVGITDKSFAQPYVLLRRELPQDKGALPLQDRVAITKSKTVSELKSIAQSLRPRFPETDVLGALIVGAEILRQSPGRKVLVLFSDMRHATKELNLERPAAVDRVKSLAIVEKQYLGTNLEGVEAYVLGADGAGKSVAYWESLRQFWVEYFRKSGAILKTYSVMREQPEELRRKQGKQ